MTARRKFSIVVPVVVACAGVLTSPAFAAQNVGCYRPTADRLLRIVPVNEACLDGERRIKWSSDSSEGKRGARGLQGVSGETGAPGATGATGATGPVGAKGADGAAGASGSGAPGATGATGPQGPAGADGDPGTPGAPGATGSPGPAGTPGATGSPGPTGSPGAGAILASSSGQPAVATTIAGGLSGTVTVMPLSGSTSETGVSVVGGTIDLTGITTGQPVARNGTITSVAGFASLTVAMALVGSTVTQTISVWQSTTPNNVYTQIPGTEVTLVPPLTGIVPIGTTSSGITTGLAIPVSARSNLIVVYATTASGVTLITTTQADTSASVSIA